MIASAGPVGLATAAAIGLLTAALYGAFDSALKAEREQAELDAKVAEKLRSETIADARARAEQIASQGGRTVKELRAARMGVFQITPLYATRGHSNWEGENDISSLEKNIMAVVNATFSMN